VTDHSADFYLAVKRGLRKYYRQTKLLDRLVGLKPSHAIRHGIEWYHKIPNTEAMLNAFQKHAFYRQLKHC